MHSDGPMALGSARGRAPLALRGPQAPATVHPLGAKCTSSVERRARLTAAARRLKSAANPQPTAYPGCAPSVLASHEVGDLALDLWPGCPVVGDPVGVLLAGPGSGEHCFVRTDSDVATLLGLRALRPQRARCTGFGEVGDSPHTITVRLDRPGPPRLARALMLLIEAVNLRSPRLSGDGRTIAHVIEG